METLYEEICEDGSMVAFKQDTFDPQKFYEVLYDENHHPTVVWELHDMDRIMYYKSLILAESDPLKAWD